MGKIVDRDWLASYKTNPKEDRSIYKNYQNPSSTQWEREMGSLSPAQKERYEGFLKTIPDELRGLSALEMQKYLQNVQQRQGLLDQEKESYYKQKKAIQTTQSVQRPVAAPVIPNRPNQKIVDELKNALEIKLNNLRNAEKGRAVYETRMKDYNPNHPYYKNRPIDTQNAMHTFQRSSTNAQNSISEINRLIPEIHELENRLTRADRYWQQTPEEAARLRTQNYNDPVRRARIMASVEKSIASIRK